MGTDLIKCHCRTPASKMSKFLIIKIRTGCQNIRYFYCSEKLYWAARKLRLGRGLDVAAVDIAVRLD